MILLTRREFIQRSTAAAAFVAAGCSSMSQLPHTGPFVYELRIYTIHPGKTDALHNRFRNHTLRLFQKHGIESVGYWMPLDPADQRLHFLLRYPSRERREASWKTFAADPEWQAAAKASEASGPLVARVENPFFVTTDYSPRIAMGNVSHGGVFEFRDYTTPPGLLPDLDARFRNHTLKLFEKHGMGNWAYFHRMADQTSANVKLEYFLHHKSKAAGEASFKAFREDPLWIAARKASEDKAGGSLTVPNGVKSTFLAATDYSPTK